MLLPHELRGLGLSKEFVIAFDNLVSSTRYRWIRTANIKKPALARRLQDWDFEPESRAGEAELLPRRLGAEDLVPRVVFKDPDQAENVPFYNAVSSEDSLSYPLSDPARSKIFLNTRFVRPKSLDEFVVDCDFTERALRIIE